MKTTKKTEYNNPAVYQVRLSHDKGRATIQTTAPNCREAVRLILDSEKAPRRAVQSVYRVHDGGRLEYMSHDLF